LRANPEALLAVLKNPAEPNPLFAELRLTSSGDPTVFRAKISDEREVRRWRFVKLLTSPYRLLLLSLKNVRTARVACSPMKAARMFTSCSAPPGRGRTRQLIQQSGRQRTSKAPGPTRAARNRSYEFVSTRGSL
jgi:hypothetical protein